MKFTIVILSSLLLFSPQILSAQYGWQNLLQGENLDNWEV